VNLHVMHDAKTLARLSGATPPACDALACQLGRPDRVAAAWIEGNPLQAGWLASLDAPAPRLLCWSGSLADEPFATHPANWMRPGRAALVLLQDLGPTTDDDLLTPVPLGQGVLPAELVRDLIRKHVPAETPLVLQPQDLAAQTAWLQG
jgi:hypothetical protein